jgi:sterol desaturase/sphingolipid hydroxylase (fatty acid hydroxylase superfamily)
MDIITKIIPNFLHLDRIVDLFIYTFSSYESIFFFTAMNGSLAYTLYNNTFKMDIFVFSYLICGILQGTINSILYYLVDVLIVGKPLDVEAWKKTKFYQMVVYNLDGGYIYILGGSTYTALTLAPESMQWTLVYPGYKSIILQVLLLALLHDFFFTTIHYAVHKIPYFRAPHFQIHHNCPFEIGSSRCAISSTGNEALVRDLYSGIIPTYIISYFFMPFYGYIWIYYYSIYTLWAMYSHTGLSFYHTLHHSKNPELNYGLYFITDYFMGTLVLNVKDKENKKEK